MYLICEATALDTCPFVCKERVPKLLGMFLRLRHGSSQWICTIDHIAYSVTTELLGLLSWLFDACNLLAYLELPSFRPLPRFFDLSALLSVSFALRSA